MHGDVHCRYCRNLFLPKKIGQKRVSEHHSFTTTILETNSEKWFIPFGFLLVQIFFLPQNQVYLHRVVFSSQLKSKSGNILAKDAELRIALNICFGIGSYSETDVPYTSGEQSTEESGRSV